VRASGERGQGTVGGDAREEEWPPPPVSLVTIVWLMTVVGERDPYFLFGVGEGSFKNEEEG
jgi:hypothetical protein